MAIIALAYIPEKASRLQQSPLVSGLRPPDSKAISVGLRGRATLHTFTAEFAYGRR